MKEISWERIVWSLVACAAMGFLSWGLTAALLKKGIGSAEAAAWVQAVGATAALAIAVGVPYFQHARAERERKGQQVAEQLAVCTLLQDELQNIAEHFSGELFIDLLRDAPGEMFRVEMPAAGKAHPVFDAFINQLPKIDDAKLRRGLIQTYGSNDVLWDLLEINTGALHRFVEIKRAVESATERGIINGANDREKVFLHAQLIDLRKQMRFAALDVNSNVSLALVGLRLQIQALQAKTQLR